jgi:hypothetical protein
VALILLTGIVVPSELMAGAVPPTWIDRLIQFDIPAQPLPDALMALVRQTGVHVTSYGVETDRFTSKPLHGRHTLTQALDHLLAGTELRYRFVTDKSVSVYAQPEPTGPSNGSSGRGAPVGSGERGSENEPHLEEVRITGTHLYTETSSQEERVYDHEALMRSGAASLDEFALLMPENLASITPWANLFGNTAAVSEQGSNVFLGSGFNLLGASPIATLTLLDGNRWAGGGASAGFFDLSLIPWNAIDHVVVQPGDASSIYGSDAIAGVVNIILRQRFDGLESVVRYDRMSGGGGAQWTASQTAGKTWQDMARRGRHAGLPVQQPGAGVVHTTAVYPAGDPTNRRSAAPEAASPDRDRSV